MVNWFRAANHSQTVLQFCGLSRLPDAERDKPKRQRFNHFLIGFLPINIAEGQKAEGERPFCVGIDMTAKFAVAPKKS